MADRAVRAKQFIARADKLLRWAESAADEMQRYGAEQRMDDIERTFAALLAYISSAHESISSAAKHLRMKDWRKALDNLRYTDELLFYLWKARDSETHDSVIKWRPSMLECQLVVRDAAKVNAIANPYFNQRGAFERLFFFVYGVRTIEAFKKRVNDDPMPSLERMEKAGVELRFAATSLALDSFGTLINGKQAQIAAPESHLGQTIPPSAIEVASRAIKFYRAKVDEIRSTAPPTTPATGPE